MPKVVQDMAVTAYSGAILYVVLFIATIYATGYQHRYPVLTGVSLTFMVVLSSARIAISYHVKRFSPKTWVRWFSVLTILITCVWSIYWAIVIHKDGLNSTTLLAIIAMIGIASAGVGILSPLRNLSYALLIIMLWPSGLILIQQPDGVGVTYSVMIACVTIFLASIITRMHAHYWAMHQTAFLLEEKARDLSEATNAKSQFLARMSHEIRTPMNGIVGMTDLLRNANLGPEEMKYTDTIHRSSELLLDILDDILDFTRIESGKMNIKHTQFDIVAIITETVEFLKNQANEKHLTIHIDTLEAPDYELLGDPGRIRQILTNLVGNAIKFTGKGSITVRLKSDSIGENTNQVLIEVIDTGIGVPEDAHAQIFEVFEQVDDSTTRRADGAGLGLAISKQLVEMMHGEIGIKNNSDTGVGSTFWFQIPFDIARASSHAAVLAPDPKLNTLHSELLKGVHILVAEDNPVNQLVIKMMLESLGCKTSLVNDGIEVVTSWKENRYDLILMDIQMPNRGGIAATKIIRALENGEQHIRIIALTANAYDSDRDRCLEAGLDDYLSKPCRINELKHTLEYWVREDRKASIST